jgi:hypothetical protein
MSFLKSQNNFKLTIHVQNAEVLNIETGDVQ